MVDEAPDSESEELVSRSPERRDLTSLCRELNSLGARYVIIGGFAIIHAGYPRTTGDIDLLIEATPENEKLVFSALESLPDQAVKELTPGEVSQYVVVRVADEIVVDLMASASGIDYSQAVLSIITRDIDGVLIPFASPELLLRMKSCTHREKDAPDVLFLRQLLATQ